jgi:MFS family permease
MMSYLALGWAAPRLAARGVDAHRVIALGIGGMVLAQAAMLFTQSEHAWVLWLLLAMCVPVMTLAQSHVALAFPASLAGRANSAYNLLLFVGAFSTQWGFGLLADELKANGATEVEAFRTALAIAVALQAAALVYFVASRAEPHD